MAIVTLRVLPDIAAFVRGGYDPQNNRIEVDLDALAPAERSVLAGRITQDLEIRAMTPYGGYSGYLIRVQAPTLDALFEAITAEDDATTQYVKRQEADTAAARERALAVLRKRQTRSAHTLYSSGMCYDYPVANFEADAPQDVVGSPEAVAWQAELDAIRKAAAAQAEADAAADKEATRRKMAELAAAEEVGRKRLKEWALQHGSRRLHLLIEEDHKAWLPIARGEYLTAATPAGYSDLSGYTVQEKDRTKPTEADILTLRAARTLAAERPDLSDPHLLWAVLYRPTTKDEYVEVLERKFAAICLTVSTPDGASQDVYMEIAQA